MLLSRFRGELTGEIMVKLIRPVEDLHVGVGEVMAIKSTQEIPQEFIDANRADYDASMDRPIGNWMKVATIPASVINHWFRQGFDIFDPNTSVSEIQARLKAAGLDYFLTTKKQA